MSSKVVKSDSWLDAIVSVIGDIIALILFLPKVIKFLYRVSLFWFRFASGMPVLSDSKTNATFFNSGTKKNEGINQWVSPWSFLPYWQRSIARFAGVVVVVAMYKWPLQVGIILAIAALCIVVFLAWKGYIAVRLWQHNRKFVVPLYWAIRGSLPDINHNWQAALSVPLKYETDESAQIVLKLPDNFKATPSEKGELNSTVTQRLPGSWDINWYLKGHSRMAIWKLAPAPPGRLTFADALPYIEKSKKNPFLGLGARNREVVFDRELDAAHMLVSGGSGAGKSVLSRAILAQELHKGAVGLILDLKRSSHSWAHNLPNVKYCRTPETIHDGIMWITAEMEKRYELQEIHGEDYHEWPTVWIIAEEMNATMGKIQRFYERFLKEKGDPRVSEAIEAFRDLLFMARAVDIHAVGLAQLGTAKALGGPEARENFGVRALARYTDNAWKMLVPHLTPIPKPSRVKGRWQICVPDEAIATQVVWFTNPEAREYALSGIVTRHTDLAQASDLGKQRVTVTPGPEAPKLTAVPDIEIRRYFLKEISEDKGDAIVPMKYAALRKAKSRNEWNFPSGEKEGRFYTYTQEEIVKWYANQPTVKQEVAQ